MSINQAQNLTALGNPLDAVIIGGCGFVGSHFVDRLLNDEAVQRVTVFDNLSAGHLWHIEQHQSDERLKVVIADVREVSKLQDACKGHSTIIHLASNPDIAAAATNPSIDFDQGTLLTHCVAEAARTSGITTVLYASGSGVYGDLGDLEADEDHGPLVPVSTYAASKLAGEALLSAYSHMFDFRTVAFRFGNVVGPRQTHGVGFDFIRQLMVDPTKLMILGDGKQSKSYVYIDDIVNAVLIANAKSKKLFNVFNVATGDYITVAEIGVLACRALDLSEERTEFVYSGGTRGWKGDVPVVRLSSERIKSLGWQVSKNSNDALLAAMKAVSTEPRIYATRMR